MIPRLFREGREATVARWLQRLDDAQLRRQPFLAAMGAWMHTIQGRVAEAEHFLDVTAGAEYGRDRPPGAGAYAEARGVGQGAACPRRPRLGDPGRTRGRRAERPLQRLATADPVPSWGRSSPSPDGPTRASGASPTRPAPPRPWAPVGRCCSRPRGARSAAIERDDWTTADSLSRRTTEVASRMPYDPDAIAAARSVVTARVALHRSELGEARRQMATFQVARAALGPGDLVGQRALPDRGRARPPGPGRPGRRSLVPPAGQRRPRPAAGPLRPAWGLRRPSCASGSWTLPPGPGGTSTLTPAEVRVLRLLPTYLTAAEMAERLFVTPNTVRTQIQALYGKLAATSRAEAVEAAIEIGLLEPLPVLAPGRITSI